MKFSPILRIASDPVALVWGGVGWLDLPADIVLPEPARAIGGGQLVQIPDLDLLINGAASRIDVTVSGVSARTIALFQDEQRTLRGALAHVGLIWFDDDWQLDVVEWLTVLTVGSSSISSQPSQDGRTRSITISLGSDFTDRNHAGLSLWTDADQRRRSPDDAFFDHVAGITTGTSRQFAPSDAS